MHSQAVNSEPLLSRDASKRKRLNRTAKLKQYKLDARREQWLAQGKSRTRSDEDQHHQGWNSGELKGSDFSLGMSERDCSPKSEEYARMSSKNSSEEFTGSVTEESDNESSIVNPCEEPVDSNASILPIDKSNKNVVSNCVSESENKSPKESRSRNSCDCPTESRSRRDQMSVLTTGDCTKHNSLNNFVPDETETSPNTKDRKKPTGTRNTTQIYDTTDDGVSELKKKHDQVKHWLNTDLSACLADDNPAGSRVGRIGRTGMEGSLEEEDWEAAADALCVKESSKSEAVRCKAQQSNSFEGEREPKEIRKADLQILKPNYKVKSNPFLNRSKSTACAWRPDDLSRPPTLPTLRNHQSVPRDHTSVLWSPIFTKSVSPAPSTPVECPICAEELDSTDSSFVPCACGFRPCLFCVHRIASEDGRCPGCRREYSFDVSLKSVQPSSVRYKA